MAKHDTGTPTDDGSANEVANQFSPSKSRSKSNVDSKVQPSSKANASREAQVAEEISSGDEEPSDKKADKDEDGEGDDGGEEDEYEIERIVEVEVGAIDDSPNELCYFVHWKGYADEEDSWTTESNAGGAQDLIKTFWRERKRAGKPSRQDLLDAHEAKQARKNKKRKSLGTPGAKKPRASQAVDASSEDLGEMASKKSSGAKLHAKSKTSTPAHATSAKRRRSNVMDIDEEFPGKQTPAEDEDDVPLTKKRKSGANTDHPNGRSASKKKSAGKEDLAIEPAGIQNDLIDDTMKRYGRTKSWEEIVKTITTVEKREEDGQLQIFWTSVDGWDCLTPSTTFKKRCPQKLIQFYESNLKWRPHDGPDETTNGAGDAMQE